MKLAQIDREISNKWIAIFFYILKKLEGWKNDTRQYLWNTLILYCVLFCIVLYCFALYYIIILYCITLYCIILRHSVLYHIILY